MKIKTFTESFGCYLRTLIVCSIGLVATDLSADQKIHLKAHNGQYVVAEEGGGREVYANRDVAKEWETFTLIDLNGGRLMSGDRVHLRTSDGRHFLVAEDGGGRELKADRTRADAWETFTILRVRGSGEIRHGDAIALKTANGTYVVAEEGGGREVNANRNAVDKWETFSLELVGGEPEAFDDTRTVSIEAGSLTFRPRHTRGDREFKGHGPKITAEFTVYVSADRKKLMAKIWMKAQEWDSDDGRPQSDYTTAEGQKEFVLHTVPGEGWRIFAFELPGVIKPTQEVSESRGYIDDDEEVDSFSGKKVVRWWHFTGDVHGDDAGVRTKVRVEYPAFRIKEG